MYSHVASLHPAILDCTDARVALACDSLRQIINSTLGKGLGGATGGYTTGPKEIVDMLKNKGRPYLFSNTLAPAVVSDEHGCR